MAKKGTVVEKDIYDWLKITREDEKRGIGAAQKRNEEVLNRLFPERVRRKKVIEGSETDRR